MVLMNTGDTAHTMAAYLNSLLMHGDTGDDYASHPVLSEGAARFGRRVFVWDDYGFYGVDTYASTAEACAAMARAHDDYDYDPDDDHDPDACDDDEWRADDEHLPRGLVVGVDGRPGAYTIRETTSTRARVVLVHDDYVWCVGRDEITAAPDYCRECGAPGCQHDGRDHDDDTGDDEPAPAPTTGDDDEPITPGPVVWAVHTARRISRADGWHTTRHLPTFYVYASTEREATRVAMGIVDDDDTRNAMVVSCGPVWAPVGLGDTARYDGPGPRRVHSPR